MRGDMGSHDEIDDNLIAAYAEGRLTGARRARMEAHLATDPEARAHVAALVIDRDADDGYRPEEASPTPPAAPREEAAWSRWLPFAAAATVLLAVGAAVLTRPADTTALDTTARMVAAAEDLEARRPDLFRGFRPVEVAALPRRAPAELRGGILVTAPRERTILGRPELDWRPVAGVTAYDVTVTRPDGTSVLSARAGAPPFAWPADAPELAPGAYVVDVSGAAAYGRAEGRRYFHVASEEERRTLSDAAKVIAGLAPPDVASLLAAHDALRRGFPDEALRLAREHANARPQDPAGAALVEHLRTPGGAR